MKKIYFIYASIPEEVYNKRIKYLISNNHDFRWKHGKMYGLYAWTTSKKLLKEFLEVRVDAGIYNVIEKEVYVSDELQIIKEKYTDLELKLERYYLDYREKKEMSIDIVSTKNEYSSSVDYSSENLLEFGPVSKAFISFQIFNTEIVNALDTIGYTTDYIESYGSDEDRAYLDNRNSYNLTFGGNKPVRFDNQMLVLLFLFHFMFYGTHKRKEE